jgi:hypothetical protein
MKKLLFLIIGLLAVNCLNAQTYNPLTDFKANENPSGVWSFGYGTVGGDFKACPKMVNRETAFVWETNEAWKGVLVNPANGKDLPLSEGLVLKKGMVVMHPGNKGDHLSKIRFTTPADGQYTVNAKWTNIDVQAKKTWVWVYSNAAKATGKVYFTPGFKELFSKGATGVNQSVAFSQAVDMKKGEIISFEVGNAGDTYLDDSQSIELTIVKAAAITLYKGSNFTGESLEISGDWSARDEYGTSWNDVIRSIKIPAGWEVTIYENGPLNSPKGTMVLTKDWNAPSSWFNRISNIGVRKL